MLWIFGGRGSSQNWTIYGGHFYAFKDLLLTSRYRMGIFLGVVKFKTCFGGMPDIPVKLFFLSGGGGGGKR